MAEIDVQIDQVLRAELPRVRAHLIGLLRDFDFAEDVLGDALLACALEWPQAGVPDNPAGWLYVVARNKARDQLRHRARGRRIAAAIDDDSAAPLDADALASGLNDDYLRLLFSCCHPALAADAQIALTLRTVVGLEPAAVARALLVSETALEQRLTRAKRKIRSAGIPWQVPRPAELPERLGGVLTVIYLIFTEGYAATSGADLTHADLCRNAIRLARDVNRMLRGHAEAVALLALLLFQDSRREARVDAAGRLLLLPDQDRSRWNRAAIREAQALLQIALGMHQVPGAFQIQAAIAALHAEAATADATDWRQIAALYERLEALTHSAVVRLNRAVAVAMVDGPAAGLRLLDTDVARELSRYHLFHSTRADFFCRIGDVSEAREAFRATLDLTRNDIERRYLESRIAALPLG
jgi:RNA polymerase sigma-70 factor (ECF subfamily)